MSQEIGTSQMEYAQDLTEVPSVLRYSDILKVGSPVADMTYNTLIPSNGSGGFGPNQQIRIPFNVPTDAFCNLKNAYLKMTVKNSTSTATQTPAVHGGGSASLDPFAGVASFIDTWRVVSGTGALLEEIQHYNAAYALMTTLSPSEHSISNLNTMEGHSEAGVTEQSEANVGQTNTSDGIGALASTRSIIAGGGATKTYTHIPMSGFMSSDRLAPLGFATGTAYIEITLPNLHTPLTYGKGDTSTPIWTIENVELHVPVLRMSAEFNASFRQLLASGIPINYHSQSFTNIQSNLSSGTSGQHPLVMATRKRSCKSIFTMFRKSTELTNKVVDSVSARRHCGVQSYNYTIGGQKMPSKDITFSAIDTGETYGALVQCLSNLGNINSSTCINKNTFRAANDTTGASKVAFGLDLEAYGHSDVQSGKNLANQGLPIVFEANYQSGATNNCATDNDMLVDCFILHDVVYSLDGISGNITANA